MDVGSTHVTSRARAASSGKVAKFLLEILDTSTDSPHRFVLDISHIKLLHAEDQSARAPTRDNLIADLMFFELCYGRFHSHHIS
jgi:hypothetical protein